MNAIEDFRGRWIQKSRNDNLRKLSLEQLLCDSELLSKNGLSYAALILFGTRQALGRFLSPSEVIFEYRSDEVSGPSQQRVEFRQGFFSFYEELWKLINLRNDLQHFQDGLFIWDIHTFNEVAVREAVLNAVSHRDYRMAGSIFIRQYSRRLEIVSPGGFPAGINSENVLWEQSPRNRRLAETFARCGLVDRSGQGMNRIYESCIRESKAKPDFTHTDQYHVWLTLHGEVQDIRFLRFLEKVGIERLKTFTTQDLMVLDQVLLEKSVSEELKNSQLKLLEEGIIERISHGRNSKYILSRRFYEFLGKRGVYTRKKGLDRATNKELLLKHILDNQTTGARMEEFRQVLPTHSRSLIQVLLRELSKEGKIHSHGVTRGARWYAGTKIDNCDHCKQ